jgi:uncharacterized membrane protein
MRRTRRGGDPLRHRRRPGAGPEAVKWCEGVSTLSDEKEGRFLASGKWPLWVTATVLLALAGFLLLPGSVATKTHLALHGLCAQRPSHSLYLGDSALPLDARMTGLYISAAVTFCWLFAAGRLRATRHPPRTMLMVLAALVAVLAGDGLNALAVDLGLPHPYEPSNLLRLVTGLLGGTTLGVGIASLVAMSVWAGGDRRLAVVTKPRELLTPLGIGATIGALALSDLAMLYAPYAVGLLVAAIAVFAAMGTALLALLSDRAWSVRSYRELAPLAGGGLIVGTFLIGLFAAARLLAEAWFGLPQLT